jgi:hypothetical protein
MKQLEITFVKDNNIFTQLQRNDKAAMYKRETADHQFVSFEVFAILSKNGVEIYPEKHAMSKWAWCPLKQERADRMFNDLTAGDIVIPAVDPETSEMIPLEFDPSYDEVMAQDEAVTTEAVAVEAVAEPIVEAPVTISIPVEEILEDPTAPVSVEIKQVAQEVVQPEVKPEVQAPVVQPTQDGGAVVVVATVKDNKVKVNPTFNFPTGEFTQADFANANGLPERGAVWGILDKLVRNGILHKDIRKVGTGKGKGKQFFAVKSHS